MALDNAAAGAHYNPAGIVLGPRIAATWTHASYDPDMSLDQAAASYFPRGRLGMAAEVLYHQARFESTNEQGEVIGYLRAIDVSPSVSAAYKILPSLCAGLTAKAAYSALYDLHALAFAVDAGADYQPTSVLTLGLAVANLGPNYSNGDPLPRMARLGFALNPRTSGPVSILLTGEISRDVYRVADTSEIVEPLAAPHWQGGGGVELGLSHLAFVRVGYRCQSGTLWNGLTWGVGLEHRGIELDVGVASGSPSLFRSDGVRLQISGHV